MLLLEQEKVNYLKLIVKPKYNKVKCIKIKYNCPCILIQTEKEGFTFLFYFWQNFYVNYYYLFIL